MESAAIKPVISAVPTGLSARNTPRTYFHIQMPDSCSGTPPDAAGEVQMRTNASFDISHSERGNYLRLKWKGSQTPSTIQDGCNQMLELLIGLGAGKVLNDSRYSTGSWTTSIPWVVFHFLPLARRSGMRKAAHVISHDRASKLSADSAKLVADICNWNIEVFRTVEEARAWLAQD